MGDPQLAPDVAASEHPTGKAEHSSAKPAERMRVDGLTWCFLFLTAGIWLPVVWFARECDERRPALLYGLLLLLEAALLGVFLADDVGFICLCLQSSTLILFLLVSGWARKDASVIARQLLLFNLAGGLLLLVGLLGLAVAGARMSETDAAWSHSFSYSLRGLVQDIPHLATIDVAAREYWNHAHGWILAVVVLGLAIITPLVPFHGWFVAAVAESPLCIGLALLGAASRVSTYLFARLLGPLMGGASSALLIVLIVLGAVHLSLLALAHGDMRKMTACLSLSQGSLATAGLFCLHLPATIGGVLLSIAGGLAAPLLLFAFGSLEMRHGVRELTGFSGIARRLPQTSAILAVAVFSLVGIPGLCGFAGLFTTLGALFDESWRSAFLAFFACSVGAWALFWMLQNTVFGVPHLPLDLSPTDHEDAGLSGSTGETGDLATSDLLTIAPVLAGMIVLGIRPQAIVDLIQSSLRSAYFLS